MSQTPRSDTETYKSLRRHDKYYLNGGDLFLLAQRDIFRIHKYFFERDSDYWFSKLQTSEPIGSADSNAIVLQDIESADLATFLWVFYNPKYSLYNATVEDWSTILALASFWSFREAKSLAVRELERLHMEDIDRIVLYQDHGVDRTLLIPRYAALAARDESISLEEGMRLGLETALTLARARELARGPPMLPDGTRASTPSSLHEEEMCNLIVDLFGGNLKPKDPVRQPETPTPHTNGTGPRSSTKPLYFDASRGPNSTILRQASPLEPRRVASPPIPSQAASKPATPTTPPQLRRQTMPFTNAPRQVPAPWPSPPAFSSPAPKALQPDNPPLPLISQVLPPTMETTKTAKNPWKQASPKQVKGPPPRPPRRENGKPEARREESVRARSEEVGKPKEEVAPAGQGIAEPDHTVVHENTESSANTSTLDPTEPETAAASVTSPFNTGPPASETSATLINDSVSIQSPAAQNGGDKDHEDEDVTPLDPANDPAPPTVPPWDFQDADEQTADPITGSDVAAQPSWSSIETNQLPESHSAVDSEGSPKTPTGATAADSSAAEADSQSKPLVYAALADTALPPHLDEFTAAGDAIGKVATKVGADPQPQESDEPVDSGFSWSANNEIAALADNVSQAGTQDEFFDAEAGPFSQDVSFEDSSAAHAAPDPDEPSKDDDQQTTPVELDDSAANFGVDAMDGTVTVKDPQSLADTSADDMGDTVTTEEPQTIANAGTDGMDEPTTIEESHSAPESGASQPVDPVEQKPDLMEADGAATSVESSTGINGDAVEASQLDDRPVGREADIVEDSPEPSKEAEQRTTQLDANPDGNEEPQPTVDDPKLPSKDASSPEEPLDHVDNAEDKAVAVNSSPDPAATVDTNVEEETLAPPPPQNPGAEAENPDLPKEVNWETSPVESGHATRESEDAEGGKQEETQQASPALTTAQNIELTDGALEGEGVSEEQTGLIASNGLDEIKIEVEPATDIEGPGTPISKEPKQSNPSEERPEDDPSASPEEILTQDAEEKSPIKDLARAESPATDSGWKDGGKKQKKKKKKR